MKFQIFKNNEIVHEIKDFDICLKSKRKSIEILKGFLVGMGVPRSCNIIDNQTSCSKTASIIKVPLTILEVITKIDAKPATMKMLIDHDTGKSCFDAQYEIVKLT